MASPPFSIAELIPGDADIVAQFPATERTFRDIVESWLSMEHDPGVGRHKFPTDTTANLGALSFTVGSIRFDTTLDVLQYGKAPGVWDAISVPTGTRAVFQQTNAPPGWTKETDAAFNNATFQIFTGAVSNGGSTAFATVFGARTIAQANLPNVNFSVTGSTNNPGTHTHTIGSDGAHRHFEFAATTAGSLDPTVDNTHSPARDRADGTSSGNYLMEYDDENIQDASVGLTSESSTHNHGGATGSSGSHTHTVTGTAASGGSGTALDFAVKFIGCIVAEKD